MASINYQLRLVVVVMMLLKSLLLLLQGRGSNACLEEERVALLQLKASFNYTDPDESYGMNTWRKDVDCCNWGGVGCNATTGRVYQLILDYFRDGESVDHWYFNASMFLPFQELRSLSLRSNSIVCCVKNEGFERLTNRINLEYLNLSYNKLEKTVLLLLHGLHSLKTLDISYTQLKGSINMKDLVALLNLEELDVSGNNIDKFIVPKDIKGQSNISILRLEAVNMGSNFQLESLKAFPNLNSLHLEYNNFTGVSLSQGLNNVKKLYLDESSLDMNILQSLGALRSLQTLSLSYCKLTGRIQGLCHFANLQELDLSGNKLSGNLPHCLVNLTLLQELDLSDNHFIGKFSQSPLKFLTSITSLILRDNQFEIPSSLSPFFNHSKLKNFDARGNKAYTETEMVNCNLTPKFQLESLSLSSTSGRGSFPEFLYHQHDLHDLDISGIPMIGLGSPSWLLENNTKLESLVITDCSLSGTLGFPAHNPNATLSYLDISGNHLYGHIPTEMCAYFPRLEWLDLSENEFTGSFPESLSKCSFLMGFFVRDNKLFDKVPKWIGTTDSLRALDLSKNMLFGSIPTILGTSQLRQIYLLENRLEGPFPNLTSVSNHLEGLDLSHNCLIGIIPKWIEKFYKLRFLFLSHNNFIGEIPINLWKMTNELRVVDLSHNKFSVLSTDYSYKYKNETFGGGIYEIGEFEFVLKGNIFGFKVEQIVNMDFVGLDLSNNNLKGRIPYEFGSIQGINLLNLSHNILFGPIPFSFSNMSEIETLDLSCNNLSGTIPRQLTELNFLEVFNVSYNNLSGEIPNRVAQFATFDDSSYEGNPFLCGLPLLKNCNSETPTPPSSNDDEVDDELVDMHVFYISFSVTFIIILVTMFAILYINSYWQKVWFYFIEKTIDSCYYFLVNNFLFYQN